MLHALIIGSLGLATFGLLWQLIVAVLRRNNSAARVAVIGLVGYGSLLIGTVLHKNKADAGELLSLAGTVIVLYWLFALKGLRDKIEPEGNRK